MKLGELPKVTVHERDAVHVAIASVIATMPLYPGEHVGINPDSYDQAGPQWSPHIGIVDPFLEDEVQIQPGQRFIICLYPETTTSLKHVWTHPSFRSKSTP